jgi:hypothetical protein
MAERLTLSGRANWILHRVENILEMPGGELTLAMALEALRDMAKLLRDMAHSVEWMDPAVGPLREEQKRAAIAADHYRLYGGDC